jgi:hypothetical protein
MSAAFDDRNPAQASAASAHTGHGNGGGRSTGLPTTVSAAFSSTFSATGGSLAVLGLSVLAVAGAAGMLLWPAVVASEERAAECGRLLSQVERHDAIAAERDAMRVDLASARTAAARVLRTIPQGADQAHRLRLLAVGTGPDMGTQTIVAGEPVPATPDGAAASTGGKVPPSGTSATPSGISAPPSGTSATSRARANAPLRAVPVTVEMRASFERVMEVLARAEGDRRLVRPIHIEIQRPDESAAARAAARGGAAVAPGDASLVEARLELDAVFAAGIAATDLAGADSAAVEGAGEDQ